MSNYCKDCATPHQTPDNSCPKCGCTTSVNLAGLTREQRMSLVTGPIVAVPRKRSPAVWIRKQTDTLVKRFVFYDMWKNEGDTVSNQTKDGFTIKEADGTIWELKLTRISVDKTTP